MKFTTLMTAVALLLTSTTLANAVPHAEADDNPQICYCSLGCYDSCGQKFCCVVDVFQTGGPVSGLA
ncbi:hypothetical protein VC83_03025 [Pseudogymnoascus destructans]|uniref:Uncharacterized protein n=1 Tax=Pseudogymnoascus destructans TaxID=655981 RepID=A0A177ADC9_9PEZI|nr:uncharacterized protein VC83_03025 [Pseudogymnoascus destructans]OAF60115.1 hypothetical protein VC83_03025 [Pseudogymnoascus destructans]